MPAKTSHAKGRPAVAALLGTASGHLDQELAGKLGVRRDDGGGGQVSRLGELVGAELQLVELAHLLLLGAVMLRNEEPGSCRQALEDRSFVGLFTDRRQETG